MKKKVSIIIRTKNEEQWIEICIKKILEQTYKNFEIIIIDSYSTDKTLKKVQKFKLKSYKIKKFTPGKAINLGVKKSSGDYLVCLSAHCIPVDKNWLKNLIKDLDKKNVVAIYGKQSPLPYSNPLDKRDLYNTFGLEKRIQKKDTFFHNANSAFTRKIWNKIKFDEKILHIEDRIWAQKIINLGKKIVYEPKADVYHWHGINHSLDEKRCSEIVSILEKQNFINNKNINLLNLKGSKCAAVIPIRQKTLELTKNLNLLNIAIRQLKKSKLIKDIFVYTSNKTNKDIAKKEKIKLTLNRASDRNFYIDIISSLRNFLDKLESKGNFYDYIMVLTENFPFRPQGIFDRMIRLAISKNYDTVLTSFELKGSIFQKKGKKYNNLVDGFIPSKINKEMIFSRVGVATLFKVSELRVGNILDKNIGFYLLKDQESFIEVNSENIKNFQNRILSQKITTN